MGSIPGSGDVSSCFILAFLEEQTGQSQPEQPWDSSSTRGFQPPLYKTRVAVLNPARITVTAMTGVELSVKHLTPTVKILALRVTERSFAENDIRDSGYGTPRATFWADSDWAESLAKLTNE